MASATAARDRHAVRTETASGDFERAELSAFVAGVTFNRRGGRRFAHDSRPKFSAMAMALRMDMDLLMVS